MTAKMKYDFLCGLCGSARKFIFCFVIYATVKIFVAQ